MLCHDQEPLDGQIISNRIPRLIQSILRCRENFWPRCVLLHSEQRSQFVADLEEMAAPVYYWSHALIAQDWFRYAEHDPKLRCTTAQQTFLIYSRAWSGSREYRLKFADMLIDNQLITHCRTAFNPNDPDHYTQHKFVNSKFQPYNQLEQHLPINTYPSWASADYSNDDYSAVLVEIVLETLFDDTRHHLTEKTLRPIACGKPFLLAATPGSLEYLRSYGFCTFESVMDESYDLVQDPRDRMQAIQDQMQRIITHDRSAWLHRELKLIAQHNQQRFFSPAFTQQVIEEYQNNLTAALNTVLSHPDPTWLTRYLQRVKWQGRYSRQDAKQAWQWYHSRTK